MNICMFTNAYLPHVGGVARSVSQVANDLQKKGHQVLIIAPEYNDHRNNMAMKHESHVLRVPAIQHFNGSDFAVTLPLFFNMMNRIKAFKPDIIHSHHPFLIGDSALRIARQMGLPIVFTHHTRYEQYTHYVPVDFDVIKKFAVNLSTEYANLCNYIIAPSNSIAQLIHKRGVTRPIVEIPTGVDVNFFANGNRDVFRRRFDISDDTFVVGHVGRLSPEKNLSFLMESISHFLSKPELVA